MQVKRLLLKLERESVEEGRLMRLLSPIFAKSEEEQLLFERAFQRYFQQFDRKRKEEEVIAEEQRLKDAEIIMNAKSSSWKYLVLIVLAFLIGGGIFWKVYLQPEIVEIEEQLDSMDSLVIDKGAVIDTTETVEVSSPADIGEEEPETTEEINLTELEGEPIPLTTKGELLEEDISHLEANYWHLYGLYLKSGGIFLALFAFVLYEFFRWRRRKLILVKEELKKQPHHFHHIRLSHPDLKLFQSEEFYETAKAFRRRVMSNNARLDVEKSVETTIDEGGYPTFAYNSGTRSPEYLVLIDQPYIKSHQTRLFEQWVKELQQQDIFIERFFYRSDSRVCWKNAFEDDVYLEELANRYPKHRLLIFGDAEALVNPQNDELREWVNLFETWQQKVILSPKPTQWWTYPEIALSQQFVLLPAQPYALAHLIGIFDGEDDGNLGQWLELEELEVPPVFDVEPTPNPSEEGNTRKNSPVGRGWGWVKTELQDYLSPKTYQWLCACAVYPELHWDFTLQLGKALQLIHDYKANPIKDLLKISRLPWFEIGRMPDELRMALIRDLEKETEEVVKREIVALVEREQNTVPVVKPLANVFAAYEMLLVVKKWDWKGAFSKLRKHPPSPLQRGNSDDSKEYSVLEYVDPAAKVVLGFQLPDFLQKVFYKSGMPMLGMKMGLRVGIFLFLFALLTFLIPQPNPECLTEYNGQSYYLADSVAAASYYSYGALDTFQKNKSVDGKWQNYINSLESVIQKHPYAKAYYNSAFAHFKNKEYSRATENWRSFVEIVTTNNVDSLPDSLLQQAIFNAGVAAYADRSYTLALENFRELLQKDSTEVEFHYVKSLTFLRLHEIDSLLTGIERIEVIDSSYLQKDNSLVTPLGRLYQRTNDENLKNRVGGLLLAMEINIGDLDRQIQLAALKINADALFEQERYAQAKLLYERMNRLQADGTLLVHVNIRIRNCEEKIAAQELVKLITEADGLFANQQWEAAKNKYEEALDNSINQIKLQNQIEICAKELAKLSEQERIIEKIRYADELLDKAKYNEVIKVFQAIQNDIHATDEQKQYALEKIKIAKSKLTYKLMIEVTDMFGKQKIQDADVKLVKDNSVIEKGRTDKNGQVLFELSFEASSFKVKIIVDKKHYAEYSQYHYLNDNKIVVLLEEELENQAFLFSKSNICPIELNFEGLHVTSEFQYGIYLKTENKYSYISNEDYVYTDVEFADFLLIYNNGHKTRRLEYVDSKDNTIILPHRKNTRESYEVSIKFGTYGLPHKGVFVRGVSLLVSPQNSDLKQSVVNVFIDLVQNNRSFAEMGFKQPYLLILKEKRDSNNIWLGSRSGELYGYYFILWDKGRKSSLPDIIEHPAIESYEIIKL